MEHDTLRVASLASSNLSRLWCSRWISPKKAKPGNLTKWWMKSISMDGLNPVAWNGWWEDTDAAFLHMSRGPGMAIIRLPTEIDTKQYYMEDCVGCWPLLLRTPLLYCPRITFIGFATPCWTVDIWESASSTVSCDVGPLFRCGDEIVRTANESFLPQWKWDAAWMTKLLQGFHPSSGQFGEKSSTLSKTPGRHDFGGETKW